MTRQEIIDTINGFHETKQDAEDWWNRENPAFNLVPEDMLRTKYGLQRLEKMIYLIESGEPI
jgi:hypothetical protein